MMLRKNNDAAAPRIGLLDFNVRFRRNNDLESLDASWSRRNYAGDLGNFIWRAGPIHSLEHKKSNDRFSVRVGNPAGPLQAKRKRNKILLEGEILTDGKFHFRIRRSSS